MSAPSIVVLEEDGQPVLSCEDARAAINRVRQCVGVANAEIARLYSGRAWLSLGYATWEALCVAEFPNHQVRLAAPERREVVAELRGVGMSTRAISAAIGVSKNTVTDDLSQIGTPDDEIVDAEIIEVVEAEIVKEPPARVTGRDGKSYPRTSSRPRQPPKYGARRKHLEVLDACAAQLSGTALALAEIAELDQSVTAEEAARVMGDLSKSIRSLNRIITLLRERNTP